LEKFPESKEPLQVYTKLSMQMALVKYESGRYEDAQRDLERLRTEINPSTLPVRHDEITYHLARVMVRRGEYHEASYILEELQGGAKFKVMSDHLQGEPCVSDSEFDKLIPEVEVVLGSTRLAALLKGYYGRYAEANYSLENAIHWYQNVETQLLKKTSRGFGGSINDTSLGPLSQAPLGFEPIKAQIVLALIEISIIHKDGGRRDHYLELARSTLRSFERQFGAGHILTLEATALHAVMLSNMFDKQATSICAGAINTISRYLGKEHSLTMEVLSALVGIFIQQDRPYEAQDTITALVNQACDRLGPGHPQTVKYRCQLGEVNRIIGNYLKSRNELQSTYNHAVGESWHEGHPVILRCLTMLAFTNYSMLNLDIATEYIEKALRGQVAILKENGTGSKPAKSIADLLEGWIQKTSSSIPAANTIVTPHPDVLDSLEVYVEIRGMKEVEDTDRVGEDTLRILDFVYEKMKQCFGETHPATLKVGVRLSSMVPEESYDRKNAKQDFYDRIHHIRRQCDECLGPNHTLTWLAQMAISLSSNDLDDNLANIGNEMSVAVKRLVAQLGPRHPLTLEWMVRLFEIEVALGDESADNTAAQVLRQVRQKEVREERLMPSLDLEWKIAFLYCHQGRYEKGILILDHIEESWIKIKQFAKTSDVVEKLNDWGERFRESSKEFRNRAKDLLREKLDEGSQGSVHDRESNIRRAVTLAKTLHDERAFETVRAQFELVKVLKGTEDIQKRVERLNILSDLVATMKKVESEPDKAQDGGNREDEKRQFAELSNKILDYWEKDPQRWEGKEGYLEGSEANF
jgi:predicted negative regulator of RcsB-dependent stress response